MVFENILGRYTPEDTAFFKKVNSMLDLEMNQITYSSENRAGKISFGVKMDGKYSILPDEEEVREYREESIRSIQNYGV